MLEGSKEYIIFLHSLTSNINTQNGSRALSRGRVVYNGDDYSRNTFECQACPVTVRMSLGALTAFGEVANGEYLDLRLKDERLEQKGLRLTVYILKYNYCREFNKTVLFSAFRVSSSLMDAVENDQERLKQKQLFVYSTQVS